MSQTRFVGLEVNKRNGGLFFQLDWAHLRPTNAHIKGYNEITRESLGTLELNLLHGIKKFRGLAYFSNSTTSTILSRDACIALGTVPKGFT